MTERSDADALETARNQTEAMKTLATEVRRLGSYGRRNRLYILFDVLLTIALAVSSFIAVHASESAHTAQAAAVAARAAAAVATQNNRALCESSNVARSQQIELWNFVLGLGHAPQTAEQKKNIAAFRHELQVIYQPRDCANVSPGNPGPTP